MSTVAAPLPLDRERLELLDRLLDGLDAPTRWWLSGFIAGTVRALGERAPVAPSPAPPAGSNEVRTLTVLYGTQTGNAERIARQLVAAAASRALPTRILAADQFGLKDLAACTQLVVIISTHGDGDPPDAARAWVEALHSRRAPRLEQLDYAVLGLGDSSYPKFCAAAHAVDRRLADLGGRRLLPLAEADVDLDTVAKPWCERLLTLIAERVAKPAPVVEPVLLAGLDLARLGTPTAQATRERPIEAELLTNQRLTGRHSDRDVRHLELLIDPAAIPYLPGDSAGIWPVQDPALVEEVLEATRLSATIEVELDGERHALGTWLGQRRELTRAHRGLLRALVERGARVPEAVRAGEPQAQAAFLEHAALVDLLHEHPVEWSAEALVRALAPLKPRLYSIASARSQVGDELHLTVHHECFPGPRRLRYGCASHHLSGLEPGARVRVYLEANPRFRLPSDPARDVVMIGPGTGVAPFRAFVQERAAAGAAGRNWLFFGNPRAREDFLYQLEWQQALADGRLRRLDVAFSRDGPEKVYVQHRLWAERVEFWRWIQAGAHLYVCGDATRMAKDVHATLLRIAADQGGMDADQALEYWAELERAGRYARDVY